jgi:hypothetical protein
MINSTKPAIAVAALALGLVACGGTTSVLSPQPHLPTPPAAQSYIQIERLSRPAVKEVFEPFQEHQITNAVEPYKDPTIQAAIKGTEDALRPPTAQYFLSAELSPTGFGGRAPNDDVIDLELGVLFGKTLSAVGVIPDDMEENDCLSSQNLPTEAPAKLTTSTFPYLPNPR